MELCFSWLSVTFWVDSWCQNARCGCVRFRGGAIGRQARLRNQRHNNHSHHPAQGIIIAITPLLEVHWTYTENSRRKSVLRSMNTISRLKYQIPYVPCCTFNIHEKASRAITSLSTFLVPSSKYIMWKMENKYASS